MSRGDLRQSRVRVDLLLKSFVAISFFLDIYRNSFLLIIWLLDVQHHLGQANILSMRRTGSLSFALSLSLPQSFDVCFMRVCVCVLNFYDFIIPYFKPFVHCSSTSSSLEILWGVLLCVLSVWAGKMEPGSDKSMCLNMKNWTHISVIRQIRIGTIDQLDITFNGVHFILQL